MTSPAPMSREELLELAALDALGLLDEYEAALYTRSFHHAPAAVQDEIKDLQAAFAADPTFLPDVKPASTVRGRVLGEVRRAIEEESLELAPLAMIGRKHLRSGAAVGGPLAIASSQFWRAAAFVLAGVLVVVLYFSSQKNQENHRIKDFTISLLAEFQIQDLIAAEQGDDLVPDLLEFIDNPNCRSVVLRPSMVGATGKATGKNNSPYAVLWVDENTDSAFLLGVGFDKGKDYVLSGADTGSVVVERSFTARSAIAGVYLENASSALISLTWTISEAATDTIVLISS